MWNRVRYLEDYQIGQNGTTISRTVSEADIDNFAGLTGDYTPLHMDRHYATATFNQGGRIPHGHMCTSLALGTIAFCSPHILGRGVPGAYLYSVDANYRKVIRLGDTIKTHWQVSEKANDPVHEGFGLVKTTFQIVNQDENAVSDGTLITVVRNESAGDARLELKLCNPWQIQELIPDTDKTYYLEDYPIDWGRETEGRTITEADVVNFAGFTSDYDPRYVDAEFAKRSMFGTRIAHGMLIFNISFGLWLRERWQYRLAESGVAGHLNDKVCFAAPVKIGDTIRCRYKTASTRVSKSNPGVGIIITGMQTVNQRNEVVQESYVTQLIPSRAGLKLSREKRC
jgi:3-hydroxybutyryl-CoA dehydratase